MTAEERAEKIINDNCEWIRMERGAIRNLAGDITDAIRAAVEAERERCARVAESFIPSGFAGAGKVGDAFAVARDDRARTIAAAIRKLA